MSAPGIRAPWIAGLTLFLALTALGVHLTWPRDAPPVPQSVLDARRDNTAAVASAVGRSLHGGLSGLAEVATVVDESMRQRTKPLLTPFQHRRWQSLYLFDPAAHTVVAQVGEPPLPAALGEPVPYAAGMRLTSIGTTRRIVQYAPAGAQYLLVGQFDPARLGELLVSAGMGGAWLVDGTGSVIAGPEHGVPLASYDQGSVGSTTIRGNGERTDVVAWASVAGAPSANALGLMVVSSYTTVDTAALANDYPDRAIALVVGLAVLTVIVFGALHLLVLRPIRQLGRVSRSPSRQWAKAPKRGESGHVAAAVAYLRHRTEQL